MRTPILAGNWKLHLSIAEAVDLAQRLLPAASANPDREVLLAPVFTCLPAVAQVLAESKIRLAGQNCSQENKGAFTGEVSAAHLLDCGCSDVIIGHSERRTLYGETDETINTKIKAALGAGLRVIFCIGETLEEREAEQTLDVLQRQVLKGLEGISAPDIDRIVIAYEPVWAIGTGRTATPDQAQDAHSFIRGLISGSFGLEAGEVIRILYGGSVKPDNIDELMRQSDIDGALVGGASLEAESFGRIISYNRG